MRFTTKSKRLRAGGLVACALTYALSAAPSSAQEDFTFKRVKPPAAGQKKRITIQVEETWPPRPAPSGTDEQREPGAANSPETPEKPQGETAGWFWKEISPALEAADPIRLDRALSVLNAAADKRAALLPDFKAMDALVASHGIDILTASAGKRVSPALALAVVMVESGGRPAAESSKGALGLMQLMPATAERFGVTDRSDPKQNIAGGVAYLDWLMGTFGGDPILSLAGYNAGENAVKAHNGVPPYPETRAYVPKVIAAWERARMYCQTLPRFADDGCVFELNRSFGN